MPELPKGEGFARRSALGLNPRPMPGSSMACGNFKMVVAPHPFDTFLLCRSSEERPRIRKQILGPLIVPLAAWFPSQWQPPSFVPSGIDAYCCLPCNENRRFQESYKARPYYRLTIYKLIPHIRQGLGLDAVLQVINGTDFA